MLEVRIQETMSWLDGEQEVEGTNPGQEKEDDEGPIAVAWLNTVPEKWQPNATVGSPRNTNRIDDRKAWLTTMIQRLREPRDAVDQIENAKQLISAGSNWLERE